MGHKSGDSSNKDSSSDSSDEDDGELKHSDSYERSGRLDPDEDLLGVGQDDYDA